MIFSQQRDAMYPGANLNDNGMCSFKVWSPLAGSVELKITGETEYVLPMKAEENHYWGIRADNISPGTKYFYVIDGRHFPDPASYFQPHGVHSASEVIDHNSFKWTDWAWKGIDPVDAVIYELHIGTFTEEGTFLSAVDRLDDLAELGINAVEVMPVSQFPGRRNWGYDGVFPFSPANSYGRPDDFKHFVQECHKRGMAVILDVVYNHFGPEGNYLNNFGPYFTDKYKTPWGSAVNYDEAYSDQVREFFISNALYWMEQYHIDGLRLDAIHQIYDFSAAHILSDINRAVQRMQSDGKKRFVIAESDLNDIKVIDDISAGGEGFDAQWSDDFHHSLHSLLTKESAGYYSDFGRPEDLIKAIKHTFVYNGIYSPYRCRRHGNDASDKDPGKFVIFTQNHDQVGNRAFGERLAVLVPPEALKLAAAALLLSPYIPLIFMGEEYAETAPFQYFVDHGDRDLIEAVRKGRKEEFAAFRWKGEIPDPQSEVTFRNSKLSWDFRTNNERRTIRNFYKKLISLRKEIPALRSKSKLNMTADLNDSGNVISLRRWKADSAVIILMNITPEPVEYKFSVEGRWNKILDSSADQFAAVSLSENDTIEFTKYNVIILERGLE